MDGVDDHRAVAIATRFYRPYPGAGGAEVQAERLARYLVAKGRACEIVTTRFQNGLPPLQSDGGLRVRRLPTAAGPLSRPAEFLFAFWWFLANGGRFRVVHGICLSAFTLGALLGGRARGARTVVMPCTIGPRGDIAHVRQRLGGGFLWRLFAGSDILFAETSAGAAELADNGVSTAKVVDMPPLLGSPLDRPLEASERSKARAEIGLPDRPIVLYVGRLVEEKGVGLILEAWPQVAAHQDATLVLVGDGPLRQRAEALAHAHGDPDAIRIAGRVDDPDPYYRAADIFVFPSQSEAFGRALAEAMSAGIAVIVTRTGLATDWIRGGEDGVVVETGDRLGLVTAIEELLSDEARRRSLGLRALRRVTDGLGPERVGKAYLDLLGRLLDEEASPTQG